MPLALAHSLMSDIEETLLVVARLLALKKKLWGSLNQSERKDVHMGVQS